MHKLILYTIFQICFVIVTLGQSIDELNRRIESSTGENKINYQLKLAYQLMDIDESRSMSILDSVLNTHSISQQNSAKAHYLKATLLYRKNELNLALADAKHSLSLYQGKNKSNELVNRSLVALIHEKKKEYNNAIIYYQKNFEEYKKLSDYENAGRMAAKVAHLYNLLSKTQESILWYDSAIKQINRTSNKSFHVGLLMNISGVYNNYGDYQSSFEMLNKARQIAQENGYGELYKEIVERIDEVGQNKKIDTESITDYEKDLTIRKETEIEDLRNIKVKSFEEIKKLSKEMQIYELTLRVKKEEYENGLLQEKIEKEKIQDSLNQSRIEGKLLQLELDNIRLLNEKKNIENQRLLLLSLLLVCIVIFVLIVLIQKVRSKKLIEQKREEIKQNRDAIEKQRVQLDQSIKYAKRIQNAVLPVNVEFLNNTTVSGFVFNVPKADVSGDFIWHYEVDEKLVFCLADSTGHGVPGAFMSIVFSSFLDDIVKRRNIIDPSQILQECGRLLSDKVLINGDNSNEFKDGMDAVILTIDYKDSSFEFSGAMNGLYVVRNDELTYYQGDRASVDISVINNNHVFKKTKIQLKEGDSIVMTTDGYIDQKGGDDNTKFYRSRFEDLISNFSQLDLHEKRKLISNTFENWKKDKEQIDDVLLVCISLRK